MEDCAREHIRKNIGELVRTTKYGPLINACEYNRIITNVMRSRIESLPDAQEDEKHKALFLKLTKRGPTAYEDLVKVLSDLNFDQAVKILRAPKIHNRDHISMHQQPVSSQPRPIVETKPSESMPSALPEGCYPSNDATDSKLHLIPSTKKVDLPKSFIVKKSKVIHIDKRIPIYPMKSKNRGVFFMVNIIEFPKREKTKRSGAEVDSKYLLHLFQELGFVCFEKENITKTEFFDLLRQLRNSEYLAKTESFVLALMSHGEMADDMHDRVEFSGGEICKVNEIEDFFSNVECPCLRGKPKVLIFPFCRGETPDVGTHLESDSIASMTPRVNRFMHHRTDMLVCYASVRGFQALRDPEAGSWYIQAFCQVLAEHAHEMHLEDMLKLIGEKLKTLRSPEGYLQTPAYYNHGFFKLLFFNPGVYEDEKEPLNE